MQFQTTEAYLSGGICGSLWMPAVRGGFPIRQNLRGQWGLFQEGDGWSFQDAVSSLLCAKGGDFRDARLTADTEIVIIRTRHDGNGRRILHVRSRLVAELPGCADHVDSETYTSDCYPAED